MFLVPLKSVEIPSAHTEDAAILRLMQKQIIDTLNAIVEITLICNHVEIRSLLGLPLYKYRYVPLLPPLNLLCAQRSIWLSHHQYPLSETFQTFHQA